MPQAPSAASENSKTAGMLPPVSLSVLTWKSPKTLKNTLKSLSRVKDIFSHRYVICQEGDPEEIRIAQAFGFKPVPTDKNLGIQEGLARCADAAETELVLIVEGDNMLVSRDDARYLLNGAIHAMTKPEHDIKAFQLHQRDPKLSDRFLRYWHPKTPLKPTLMGRLRPGPARARVHEALTLNDVAINGNEFIDKLERGIYLTHSDCVNWCNRPFLTTRTFFLGELLPFARANPGKKRVNGMPDLEHPICCPANRHWWRGSRFRIGLLYPGIFEHNRLERNADDEKTEL
ncbi:hypothetical protein [Martelella mediterranea]|uniref:Glycosyl transferase family 2 n=1 Tax=Martelella mediterranea TaxID=293089 RepID=A0A4R3NGD1_9HYPH|nr:hypothetical protein [Martelella mediterranea]TCT31766.1 hypothetical protein EDC90_103915 [Martelella mediterranea]